MHVLTAHVIAREEAIHTRHKPSHWGSVSCDESEEAIGEGQGRLLQGEYGWNGLGLCTCSHFCEGKEVICTRHKLSHWGSVSCDESEKTIGKG